MKQNPAGERIRIWRLSVKLGDLVKYVDKGRALADDFAMTNGVVVGFDKDKDPIVFFTCRQTANAYLKDDIEVLNENG